VTFSFPVATFTKGVLKEMMVINLKTGAGLLAATIVLAASGWAAGQAPTDKPAAIAPEPAEKGPHASKLDLTPETFTKFRDLVRPAGNEWRHLKVKWFTDIVAARKKAAQEDKPLLIFRTGGAGYNDCLGVC
jgi:hypothetical protein